jgi:chaperonin GroEL
MLAGTIATIRLGGYTESDRLQDKYAVESAMWSAYSAIEEGYLPGGGVALLRASEELDRWVVNSDSESAAKSAVSLALEKPISVLIENSKRSPTQVLSGIKRASVPALGFNVATGDVEDLEKAGILEPAKALRLAMRVAFSHAKSILQTGTWDLSGPTPIIHRELL